MKTFLQMRTGFLKTLAQLKQAEGTGMLTSIFHTVTEQEAGKLCYQAEEDLPSAELSLLKDMFELNKSTWEAYKQKCRESMHI